MSTDALVSAVALLIVGAILAAASSSAFSPPAVPFGVRVPPERVTEPAIGRQRRNYRFGVAIVTMAAAGITLVLGSGALVAASVVLVVVAFALWLRGQHIVATLKQRDGWYVGRRQGAVADTSLRTNPVRYPRRWLLAPVIVIVVTAAAAIAAYSRLPGRVLIPVRHGGGTEYESVPTTIWVALVPVLVEVILTALIAGLVAVVLRARAMLDVTKPATSSSRYRGYLGVMTRAMLGVAALVNLTVLGVAVLIWTGDTSPARILAVSAAPGIIALIGAAYLLLRIGPSGDRVPAENSIEENTGFVPRDDDQHWRLGGMIYANRDDPAFLIPRRLGIGWTLNLGNRFAQAAVVGAILLTAVALVFSILIGNSSN